MHKHKIINKALHLLTLANVLNSEDVVDSIKKGEKHVLNLLDLNYSKYLQKNEEINIDKNLQFIKSDLELITNKEWYYLEVVSFWNWWCIEYCKSEEVLNYKSGDLQLLSVIFDIYKNYNK